MFLGHLDYFRGRIIDKVEALSASEQTRSHLLPEVLVRYVGDTLVEDERC